MTNMDVLKYLPNFLFMLLRAGIFLMVIPVFSGTNFPAQFKIGFVCAIAFILAPVVELKIEAANIPVLVTREIIFSLALGLSARFVFLAFDTAGQIISNAMGLSIATVFNPEIGQSTEIARLQGIIVMLLFLVTDAHHDLIYIFVKSCEMVPAGHADIGRLVAEGVAIGGRIFTMALKLAAPVTVCMIMANLLLGFLYKASPQLNIFFVSFPVFITLGFIIIILCIPAFIHVAGGYFEGMRDEMYRMISLARG